MTIKASMYWELKTALTCALGQLAVCVQTKLDARMTESSKRSAEGNGEGRKSGRQVLLERVRQQLDKEYGNDDKGVCAHSHVCRCMHGAREGGG